MKDTRFIVLDEGIKAEAVGPLGAICCAHLVVVFRG